MDTLHFNFTVARLHKNNNSNNNNNKKKMEILGYNKSAKNY